MGEIVLQQREANNEIKHWSEVFMNSTKGRGKIAVGRLEEYGMVDAFYSNSQVGWVKKNHIGETNTFITPNAFGEFNGVLDRKVANVVQIRAIGIDIDCYTVGLHYKDVEEELKKMVAVGVIPDPNLVVRSGNGIQIFYSIEGGAAPKQAWLTKHIATQFVLKTSHLGSDMACTGVERHFRMPFTVNKKPDKARQPTSSNIWRAREYDLSELYHYCEPIQTRKPVVPTKASNFKSLPKLTEMGHGLRSLNQTRLADLYRLIDLRNGDIEMRNLMTYDFAFILGIMTEDESEVILQAQKFNTNFKDPQPIKIVARTASSAFEDGRNFWNAYLDNGYTMNGLHGNSDGLIKPKNSTTIIKQQKITLEEMHNLETIITPELSYERKVLKRRNSGVKERSEYEANRQAGKSEKVEELRLLKADTPAITNKELAATMGVSTKTIQRWSKEL